LEQHDGEVMMTQSLFLSGQWLPIMSRYCIQNWESHSDPFIL